MSEFQRFIEDSLKTITLDNMELTSQTKQYDIQEDIKNLILTARTEANITQKQLASLTGLPQANISRIETGQTLPNIITLKKIADGLGKRLVIDFIDFSGDETNGNNY